MTTSSTNYPPPLRGADPDSFAHHTVKNRWPRIAQRVIDENDFPSSVDRRIRALIDELPDGTVRPIEDDGAPDVALWADWIAPFAGQSWLEIPWFAGETYFYRRILEATGYFRSGPTAGDDPFMHQKQQGFAQAITATQKLCASLSDEPDRQAVQDAMHAALWGNQADLSMWAATEGRPDHFFSTGRAKEHVLIDDTEAAIDGLDPPVRIDIIADNTGFELIADLVLIDRLLASRTAETVVVHLKPHPTFVSDALIADVHAGRAVG